MFFTGLCNLCAQDTHRKMQLWSAGKSLLQDCGQWCSRTFSPPYLLELPESCVVCRGAEVGG